MKIRILDANEMGVHLELKNGDIIEVVGREDGSGYDQSHSYFGFDIKWKDKYFELVDEGDKSHVTKLSSDMYVDVQGWDEGKIKKAAEMFSEHVGHPIWDDCDALSTDLEGYQYLTLSCMWRIGVFTEDSLGNKKEVSQDNFNQLLEEWEMRKPYINHLTDVNDNCIDNLSVVTNSTVSKPSTSSSEVSVVQRITLAHKAALQACQEATEAYNVYKSAVDELKEDVGVGVTIEEVKWEDMFDVPAKELPPEDWQEGDVVECIEDAEFFTFGKRYTLGAWQGNSLPLGEDGDVLIKEDDDGDDYYIPPSKLKWVSRP